MRSPTTATCAGRASSPCRDSSTTIFEYVSRIPLKFLRRENTGVMSAASRSRVVLDSSTTPPKSVSRSLGCSNTIRRERPQSRCRRTRTPWFSSTSTPMLESSWRTPMVATHLCQSRSESRSEALQPLEYILTYSTVRIQRAKSFHIKIV